MQGLVNAVHSKESAQLALLTHLFSLLLHVLKELKIPQLKWTKSEILNKNEMPFSPFCNKNNYIHLNMTSHLMDQNQIQIYFIDPGGEIAWTWYISGMEANPPCK